MKPMRQKLLFVAACIVSTVVCWISFRAFEGTEFGSGSLAGNKDVGGFLLVMAMAFSFKYARAAAISALVGALLSLPLYLYLVFPRPFRQVWPGQWATWRLPKESFVWNGWWVTGIVATLLVLCVSCCSLIQSWKLRV